MSVTAWRAGAASTGWRTGPAEDWSGRPVRLMPAGSVEFLRVPVFDPHSPDAAPAVRLAITARTDTPAREDWQAVTWEDGWARLLTTGQLPAGEYMLWAEITDYPQRVYRRTGLLTITPGPGYAGPLPLPPGLIGVHIGTYIGSPTTGSTTPVAPAGPGYLPALISDLIGSP